MFADQLPHTVQMILGLDRESPIFTVYADDEEQLHVYYGFERLEVVSADRHAPNFKMLVGRLYNSGIKRKVWVANYYSIEVADPVRSAQLPRQQSVSPAACPVPALPCPTLQEGRTEGSCRSESPTQTATHRPQSWTKTGSINLALTP